MLALGSKSRVMLAPELPLPRKTAFFLFAVMDGQRSGGDEPGESPPQTEGVPEER